MNIRKYIPLAFLGLLLWLAILIPLGELVPPLSWVKWVFVGVFVCFLLLTM